MSRSLDELTASELNDAIDDTNFPKALSPPCLSSPTLPPTLSPTLPTTLPPHCDEIQQNGKKVAHANGRDENSDHQQHQHTTAADTVDGQNASEPLPSNVQNGIKGFIKRTHPAPLKMVAFKGDSIDVPGTPRTPRTSTTPGEENHIFFIFALPIPIWMI